jgi:hypothetical protein
MLIQKLSFDGKRQIRLSTLSKLTTRNAFRLQWYQNHSNFHCYQQTQSFLITLYYGGQKILAVIVYQFKIVICIARLRNPTLTNREKNCRQGRFAAETRQSRGRQRIS